MPRLLEWTLVVSEQLEITHLYSEFMIYLSVEISLLLSIKSPLVGRRGGYSISLTDLAIFILKMYFSQVLMRSPTRVCPHGTKMVLYFEKILLVEEVDSGMKFLVVSVLMRYSDCRSFIQNFSSFILN